MSAGAEAAAAELMRQEEEEMTGYMGKELAGDWEFKILRSSVGAFRNPEKLRAVLKQEKQGGWTLVEKFDNERIRLKRPADTKVVEGDFSEGYDPYRTQIEASAAKKALVVYGIILSVIIGLYIAVFNR